MASQSDSDDESLTGDPLEKDRDVLREDFERDQLLENSSIHKNNHLGDGRWREMRSSRRRERKKRKRRRTRDGDGILLYEIEEGGKGNASATSLRSSMEQEAVPPRRKVYISMNAMCVC